MKCYVLTKSLPTEIITVNFSWTVPEKPFSASLSIMKLFKQNQVCEKREKEGRVKVPLTWHLSITEQRNKDKIIIACNSSSMTVYVLLSTLILILIRIWIRHFGILVKWVCDPFWVAAPSLTAVGSLTLDQYIVWLALKAASTSYLPESQRFPSVTPTENLNHLLSSVPPTDLLDDTIDL